MIVGRLMETPQDALPAVAVSPIAYVIDPLADYHSCKKVRAKEKEPLFAAEVSGKSAATCGRSSIGERRAAAPAVEHPAASIIDD